MRMSSSTALTQLLTILKRILVFIQLKGAARSKMGKLKRTRAVQAFVLSYQEDLQRTAR